MLRLALLLCALLVLVYSSETPGESKRVQQSEAPPTTEQIAYELAQERAARFRAREEEKARQEKARIAREKEEARRIALEQERRRQEGIARNERIARKEAEWRQKYGPRTEYKDMKRRDMSDQAVDARVTAELESLGRELKDLEKRKLKLFKKGVVPEVNLEKVAEIDRLIEQNQDFAANVQKTVGKWSNGGLKWIESLKYTIARIVIGLISSKKFTDKVVTSIYWALLDYQTSQLESTKISGKFMPRLSEVTHVSLTMPEPEYAYDSVSLTLLQSDYEDQSPVYTFRVKFTAPSPEMTSLKAELTMMKESKVQIDVNNFRLAVDVKVKIDPENYENTQIKIVETKTNPLEFKYDIVESLITSKVVGMVKEHIVPYILQRILFNAIRSKFSDYRVILEPKTQFALDVIDVFSEYPVAKRTDDIEFKTTARARLDSVTSTVYEFLETIVVLHAQLNARKAALHPTLTPQQVDQLRKSHTETEILKMAVDIDQKRSDANAKLDKSKCTYLLPPVLGREPSASHAEFKRKSSESSMGSVNSKPKKSGLKSLFRSKKAPPVAIAESLPDQLIEEDVEDVWDMELQSESEQALAEQIGSKTPDQYSPVDKYFLYRDMIQKLAQSAMLPSLMKRVLAHKLQEEMLILAEAGVLSEFKLEHFPDDIRLNINSLSFITPDFDGTQGFDSFNVKLSVSIYFAPPQYSINSLWKDPAVFYETINGDSNKVGLRFSLASRNFGITNKKILVQSVTLDMSLEVLLPQKDLINELSFRLARDIDGNTLPFGFKADTWVYAGRFLVRDHPLDRPLADKWWEKSGIHTWNQPKTMKWIAEEVCFVSGHMASSVIGSTIGVGGSIGGLTGAYLGGSNGAVMGAMAGTAVSHVGDTTVLGGIVRDCVRGVTNLASNYMLLPIVNQAVLMGGRSIRDWLINFIVPGLIRTKLTEWRTVIPPVSDPHFNPDALIDLELFLDSLRGKKVCEGSYMAMDLLTRLTEKLTFLENVAKESFPKFRAMLDDIDKDDVVMAPAEGVTPITEFMRDAARRLKQRTLDNQEKIRVKLQKIEEERLRNEKEKNEVLSAHGVSHEESFGQSLKAPTRKSSSETAQAGLRKEGQEYMDAFTS